MGRLKMSKMSLFTCGCYYHHGCKTAIEAASRIAAVHRAVDLRLVEAPTSTGDAAANTVAHLRLSYQLIYCRMTHYKTGFNFICLFFYL